MVDASVLGTIIKDGKNQRTLLSPEEEQRKIDTVNGQVTNDEFSVIKTFDEIKASKYSFNPGGYFDVIIEHIDITPDEFSKKMQESKTRLAAMFAECTSLEKEIINGFMGVSYDQD